MSGSASNLLKTHNAQKPAPILTALKSTSARTRREAIVALVKLKQLKDDYTLDGVEGTTTIEEEQLLKTGK